MDVTCGWHGVAIGGGDGCSGGGAGIGGGGVDVGGSDAPGVGIVDDGGGAVVA